MMKLLSILALFAGAAFAQCGANGALVFNPVSGAMDCTAKASGAEICTVTAISYTQIQAAATANNVALVTIPANWKSRGFTVDVTTPFTSGAGTVTNISASIGRAGSETEYFAPFQVFPTPSPTWLDQGGNFSAAKTSHAIVARFSVTNATPGNLSNLSAGAVAITVCGVITQ